MKGTVFVDGELAAETFKERMEPFASEIPYDWALRHG